MYIYIDINLSHGKQKRRATFILAATSASDLTTFTFSPFFFNPLTKQPPFKKKSKKLSLSPPPPTRFSHFHFFHLGKKRHGKKNAKYRRGKFKLNQFKP
jgi:hypothetical protein